MARAGIAADLTWSVADCPEGGIFRQALELKTVKGKSIGLAGVVAKALLAAADIKQPVYYAELDWDAVCRLASQRNALYAPLPKTQPVKRDLSLLLDSAVTMAQVEAEVRNADKRILRGVELFDVYEGDKLPAGKKSYAISITLQDDEKTLQDKYIDKVMGKIIDNLRRNLGAELR